MLIFDKDIQIATSMLGIALLKMFSWWFWANNKLIIMFAALKVCDVTDNRIFPVTFDATRHGDRDNVHLLDLFTEHVDIGQFQTSPRQ